MYSERDRNDDYYNKKSKKPEQNYYQAKQQQQQQQQVQGSKSDSSSKRYESRQTSEPRIMSSSNYSYNQDPDKNNYDRNRGNDQKGGMNQQNYEHRNKPPSIPRINNAGFKNLPMNIDTLPPRLKRKFLKDCGLPEELADKPLFEFAQQSSGYSSSTLPFGNRNRYDQQHRPQNFQNNNYQSKYNNQNPNYHYNNDRGNERGNSHHRSRSITPPRQQQHYTPKNEWKSPNEKSQQQQQQHEDLIMRKTEKEGGQSSFDWSEDVMANSLSLPPDVNNASSRDHKYEDNNRHRNRRRRNRR